jgi:hypothetical protein
MSGRGFGAHASAFDPSSASFPLVSVAEMSRRCPSTEFHWLPEAIDPDLFIPDRPLVECQVHVIEIGRRFDRYHKLITPRLKESGFRHIYPANDGQISFEHSECVSYRDGEDSLSSEV